MDLGRTLAEPVLWRATPSIEQGNAKGIAFVAFFVVCLVVLLSVAPSGRSGVHHLSVLQLQIQLESRRCRSLIPRGTLIDRARPPQHFNVSDLGHAILAKDPHSTTGADVKTRVSQDREPQVRSVSWTFPNSTIRAQVETRVVKQDSIRRATWSAPNSTSCAKVEVRVSQYLVPRVRRVIEDLRTSLLQYLALTNEDSAFVNSQFPRQCIISAFVFGSSMNGFGGTSSDIDATLQFRAEDEDKSNKNMSDKKNKKTIIRLLQVVSAASTKSQCRSPPQKPRIFRFMYKILKARVPVLGLKHLQSGCILEISINNLEAMANTHLLFTYSGLDVRVRSLGLYVKKWAKECNMRGASDGYLSSYDLVLMVIYYLQCKFELPSLQMLLPQHDWKAWVGPYISQALKSQLCHQKICDGFFRFYAHEFAWGKEVVSVRLGQRVERNNSAFPALGTVRVEGIYLDIEDPFLLGRNLAMHFDSAPHFEYFRNCIKKACNKTHTVARQPAAIGRAYKTHDRRRSKNCNFSGFRASARQTR